MKSFPIAEKIYVYLHVISSAMNKVDGANGDAQSLASTPPFGRR